MSRLVCEQFASVVAGAEFKEPPPWSFLTALSAGESKQSAALICFSHVYHSTAAEPLILSARFPFHQSRLSVPLGQTLAASLLTPSVRPSVCPTHAKAGFKCVCRIISLPDYAADEMNSFSIPFKLFQHRPPSVFLSVLMPKPGLIVTTPLCVDTTAWLRMRAVVLGR